MDIEYGKSLNDMLGSVIIWRINLSDLIKRIIGESVPIYIYPAGLEFDLCIDGSFEISSDKIKEIERTTGVIYTGKDVDYCFEFKTNLED